MVVVVGSVWLTSPPRVQANRNLKLSLLYCCKVRSLIGGMKSPLGVHPSRLTIDDTRGYEHTLTTHCITSHKSTR